MAKFLKDTPVYMACPACGRAQHAKLKWARNHKSLKCKDCKKTIELRKPPVSTVIAKTLKAVASFEKTLDGLREAAERQRKLHKKSKKQAKRAKKTKQHAKATKKPVAAKTSAVKPAAVTSPKPAAAVASAPELKPGQWPA